MTRAERHEIDSQAQDLVDQIVVIGEKVQDILDELATLSAAANCLIG